MFSKLNSLLITLILKDAVKHFLRRYIQISETRKGVIFAYVVCKCKRICTGWKSPLHDSDSPPQETGNFSWRTDYYPRVESRPEFRKLCGEIWQVINIFNKYFSTYTIISSLFKKKGSLLFPWYFFTSLQKFIFWYLQVSIIKISVWWFQFLII